MFWVYTGNVCNANFEVAQTHSYSRKKDAGTGYGEGYATKAIPDLLHELNAEV